MRAAGHAIVRYADRISRGVVRLSRGGEVALEEINAELGLPWGLGKVGGVWKPDDGERAAAWEMLVELSTRVALVELRSGEGLLRETLASYYALFGVTRDILRRHGVSTARPDPARGSTVSFAALAIAVLNGAIRPCLLYTSPSPRDRS